MTEKKPHQSLLIPRDNKFHVGNKQDGKHYWLTPPDLYDRLNGEFCFDFDPAPYPLPEGFDGLTCDRGAQSAVRANEMLMKYAVFWMDTPCIPVNDNEKN